MELKTFTTVEVERADGQLIKAVVPKTNQGLLTADVHKKVCEELDLRSSSFQFFPLFLGRKKRIKKLKDADYVPASSADLCVRKWCMNKSEEKKMVENDKNACHLVYLEAESFISSGVLRPSASQKEKLTEYSDPSFVIEQKFISVCHDIPEYFSVYIDKCQVSQHFGGQVNSAFSGEENENFSNIFAQDIPSPSSGEITMAVSISDVGITLHKDGRPKLLPWCCITQWTIKASERKLLFTFMDYQERQQEVTLITPQVQFILAATCEIVKEIQKQDPSVPAFHASMISTQPDGAVSWENALLDHVKAKKYNIGSVI